MPKYFQAAALAAAFLLLGGCCRDTVREMASLKDVAPAKQQRSAKALSDRDSKSAKLDRDDDDDDDERVETGSINKPDCQGQHLAYQATKEYLKNFGPKPPDQPGDRGPCNSQ